MTCLAAPTTSGPIPSPGRSNMSKESRIFLLELRPRRQPLPHFWAYRVSQQRLGPLLANDVRLFPQRVRQGSQKSLAKLLDGCIPEREQQVLERHLPGRVRVSPEATSGEAALAVYLFQMPLEQQTGPTGDRRGEGLRHELPEPSRGAGEGLAQQEGVRELVPEYQRPRSRGAGPEDGGERLGQHEDRRPRCAGEVG